GKTRVITARIAWLIAHGAAPSSILAVTFTNKAAKEMKERVAGMVEADAAAEVTTSTFHALCVRILRADAHHLGYKPNFSIYDESDTNGLIKKIITRTAAADEKLDPGLAKNLISKAKNNGWNAPQDDETLAGAVYARYEAELRALNAMDFDDLLVNAVKLLSGFPEVRARYQRRFRHLLVDEFQDTNKLQLDLVTLLAAGDPPNICVVGDDDQSIYGWRGAEASNILEFERHFPNPVVVRLEQNYRSTNEILQAANRVIKNNTKRRGKNLWSPREGGDPVQIIAVPDDREEADFIVNELAARRDGETGTWEDYAILYRMNNQSRFFEENLRRLRIPYRVVGGKSFYDRREIKDLIAYMSTLLNPQDDAALLRIVNTPPRGIGATTVEIALERSTQNKCSLFEEMVSPDFLSYVTKRASEAIRTFTDTLQEAKIRIATPGADASHIISELLMNCGYFDDLKRSCKTVQEGDSRENNARELLASLAEHDKRSRKGLRHFLDEVSLDRDREEKKEQTTGVTLITLHAAKGLEFPHVYLIGAEEGLLPHERSKVEDTIDEERRLFYVGVTRAMRSLHITHCRNRTKFGTATHCEPSRFLTEIEGEGVLRKNFEELMNTPVSEEQFENSFARLREMLSE
ncbi:MAG TPA: UvrD-helicase domain-containing protein, partial [Chthoniobacterales bacterium]|nr:UvrD-helicase domain-containing protein [Chthoniobacterales bacterium]